MERGALAELSREQSIELILGLAARVAELEAQQKQPPTMPGNASVPPAVGFKANRAERRARKRRRGHDGIGRRRQAPDVIVRCRPSTCMGCGEPLPLAGQRRVGRSQVVELPPLRPVGVEAWQYAVRWVGCGHRTKGASSAGLEPTRRFGPQIEALLAYFHERHHVSDERLVEVGRDVFGLTIHHQRGWDRPGAPAVGRAGLAEHGRRSRRAHRAAEPRAAWRSAAVMGDHMDDHDG